MATKTLKLFTPDGRALTDLASEDDSILLPTEIQVLDSEVIACHADEGDYTFESLEELCAEYDLNLAAVETALEA